jgi:segregation and condensation protein B
MAINLYEMRESKPSELLIRTEIKRILEALLFAAHDPVSLDKLREVVESFHPVKPKMLKELLVEMREEFALNRSFALEEVGDGYLLRTKEQFAPYVQQLLVDRRPDRLSRAALEVVAIIAYRQPMTRRQIDDLRGVDSSGVLQALLERGLIERRGRLEGPGKPSLYGTTDLFLKHFGLSSLGDLPKSGAIG